jgi:hypothetical protein
MVIQQSGLQPLMMEAELFSDMALINCFHTFYLCPHFDWMQGATDLSGIPGFQAHNTLACYFLLVEDLMSLSTISTTHPSFTAFQETLSLCTPELRERQQVKASKFVEAAVDAVHKHFARWCNRYLLPAALLSEKPLATVVATAILKIDQLPQDMPLEFASKVFFRPFNIHSFQAFHSSKVAADATYNPWALHCSHLLLYHGVDLRDMENATYDQIKNNLYKMYLPLASQMQFVEAGVKEARNVSCNTPVFAINDSLPVRD